MIDEKIKTLLKHPIVHELRDVRVLGLIGFLVVVLLVSWSGVRVIETNYQLQQQIARMEEQTKLLELEASNKELENEYYKSDQYLELQARKQFGKAAKGETVLIVPESVALAHTVDFPKPESTDKKSESRKPSYQQNFESWVNFLFRRGNKV